MPGIDAQRAAVRGQLLDVEQGQAVRREDPAHGGEREVGVVLVVDGVELVLVHQPQEMGELHREHAGGAEKDLQAGHEVVQVRHVGEDVVADQQIGPLPRGDQLAGGGRAEELHQRRDARRLGRGGDVGGRLDAEHRHAPLLEPAQQVAVVAGDLDHLVAGAEAEALDHRRRVGLGVAQPAVGKGGEVGVVGEDRLRPLRLGELDEQALAADVDGERIERLRAVEVLRLQVGVGERRGAEVHEHLGERRAAEAAGEPRAAHQIFHGVSPRFQRSFRWR